VTDPKSVENARLTAAYSDPDTPKSRFIVRVVDALVVRAVTPHAVR
jgi:hypothetical protein